MYNCAIDKSEVVKMITTAFNQIEKGGYKKAPSSMRLGMSKLFEYVVLLNHLDMGISLDRMKFKSYFDDVFNNVNRYFMGLDNGLFSADFLNKVAEKEISTASLVLKLGEFVRYFNLILSNCCKEYKKYFFLDMENQEMQNLYSSLKYLRQNKQHLEFVEREESLRKISSKLDLDFWDIFDGAYFSVPAVKDAKKFAYTFAKDFKKYLFEQKGINTEKVLSASKQYDFDLEKLENSEKNQAERSSEAFKKFCIYTEFDERESF